jgi:D-glycero-D-manno-heptose 1,7-bisphosphate phosphatase
MKLVILDRDGVINEDSDAYVKSVDELVFIPGSLEAIARLNHAGWRVAVATNQSGLARGYFNLDALNAMHAKLERALATVGGQLELIAFCPHGPDDGCSCRKPKPGLLVDIGRRLGVSLVGVPAIGDSLRDLEAAQAVGARPLLVRTGKGERTLAKGKGLDGVPVFTNLAAAVDSLLQEPC